MSIQVVSNNAEADAKVNQPAEAEKPEAKSDPATSAPEGEKPAEHKESEDSETPETEAKESDAESESAESLESDAPKEEASDKTSEPKKKSGFQKRIDKLNQRVSAKDQEIEYWKREALKSATAPVVKDLPKVEPVKTAAAEGKPIAENFETHAAYVEALTDWKAEQVLAKHNQKLQQEKLQNEQAKQVTTYQQKALAFKEAHPDFDEVLADLPVSPTVVGLIQTSDIGPEVAYELAKNPAEAKRIAQLSPILAAKALGAIESRIALKASGEKKSEPKRVSSAPAPVAGVGGGGRASAPKKTPEEYAAAGDQQGYKKAREEQLKQQRRQA